MDQIVNSRTSLVQRLQDAVGERIQQAIALKIRTKVKDARQDPDASSRRWPFELVQNAHDAGVRPDRTGIALSFRLAGGILSVAHDAAPFTLDDFAALLTGGSSKDFMAEDTTGRYGTGFLVSHVLSERVRVSGILAVDEEHRQFDVELYRPNDEDLVLQNVRESQTCLEYASLVTSLAGRPTATFEYVVDDERIARAGLEALEQSLPHLFATCTRLREIEIESEGRKRVWQMLAVCPERSADTDIAITEVRVSRTTNDDVAQWRVIRAAPHPSASGRLVVALCEEGEGWAVCRPGLSSTIFRQLPLLGGPQLPGWAVVDGEFEVEQERRSLHVTGDDGTPLREAFAALGGLMLLATQEKWTDGLRIAQLALPGSVTGESAVAVWTEILSTAAKALSVLPLIPTARGLMLPCDLSEDHDRYVDFIRGPSEGASLDEIWELAAACTGHDPPARALSEGWSEVVEGWEAFGVDVTWIDLEAIGAQASHEAETVADLQVDGDPHEWLSLYFTAVGKSWQTTGVTKSHLARLVPNQLGRLCLPEQLSRDGGVSLRAKEIYVSVGVNIDERLFDQKLVDLLRAKGSEAGLYALNQVTREEVTEGQVVEELIQRLGKILPDDQKIADNAEAEGAAAVALLAHLWETQGNDAVQLAWRIPLLGADGAVHLPGRRRLMLPPLAAWPEAARPFCGAYPPGRILADCYSVDNGCPLDALVAWGMAHGGLIVRATREELHERALRPIAQNAEDVDGAVLRGMELSQVALLEPELINYCRESSELARLLLGLIVCFVAPSDASWRSAVQATVRGQAGERQIAIMPALWLSDLKTKAWIPVEDDDNVTYLQASPDLIRTLLEPAWLKDNPSGVDLLVQHFGIDALDVRLLAAAGDEESRQRLRDSLAKVLEFAGGDSQIIEDIAARAAQRARNVDRMRDLGLAVQERVKVAMLSRGLAVNDVDWGYDFAVTALRVEEVDPDDLSACFEIGAYKVEIKATTTGEARLTPRQAATSADEPENFVLCVVDLRGFEGDVHQTNWTGVDVSPLCRLTFGHDLPTRRTLALVLDAESSEVPARNALALRYAIQPKLWEAGLSLDRWVEAAFPDRREPQSPLP